MKEHLVKVKQYLLSGVSYAIPFVACGGILIAVAIAFAPMGPGGPDFSHSPFLKMLLDIGSTAFSLLVPVLAGYIAYGMADRPALVPGFVGGAIANQIGAGFLGGLVAGLLAGLVVMVIKKVKVPIYFKPVMPILVIPVVASLLVGFVMFQFPRRADPRADDLDVGLAAGDGHRQPRRAGRPARRHDRLRHGRAGQQGRLFLQRRHDQGRQLRPHGRLRRRHLRAAARAGAGHAPRPAAVEPSRSARRATPAWPWA